MGLNTYVGIADAHGIESWNRKEDTTARERSFKIVRADSNRQRHAIYYEVDMSEDRGKEVEESLKDGDWKTALNRLKLYAETFRTMPNHEKSIELIPNSKLDPYTASGLGYS